MSITGTFCTWAPNCRQWKSLKSIKPPYTTEQFKAIQRPLLTLFDPAEPVRPAAAMPLHWFIASNLLMLPHSIVLNARAHLHARTKHRNMWNYVRGFVSRCVLHVHNWMKHGKSRYSKWTLSISSSHPSIRGHKSFYNKIVCQQRVCSVDV